MPLPIVKKEIRGNLDVEIKRKGIRKYAFELYESLARDNPELAAHIDRFTENRDQPGCHFHVFATALTLYKLLQAQAEADDMAREIKLDS